MKTPHISMRVQDDMLDRWKEICRTRGTTVSSQIRVLMNNWCDVEEEANSFQELIDAHVNLDALRKEYGLE